MNLTDDMELNNPTLYNLNQGHSKKVNESKNCFYSKHDENHSPTFRSNQGNNGLNINKISMMKKRKNSSLILNKLKMDI